MQRPSTGLPVVPITVGIVLGCMLIAGVTYGLVSGGGTTSSTKSTAASSTKATAASSAPFTTAQASDQQIATAAQQYIIQALGMPPNSNFINYDCPAADAGTSYCWTPYVTHFTYRSGVLRVFMQVDRHSTEGKEIGDSAAHAVMNFIKLGSPPSIVRANVDWVEAVDGTGVHIAQYSV